MPFPGFNGKLIFKLLLICILLLLLMMLSAFLLPTQELAEILLQGEQPSLELPSTGLFELIAFCSSSFQNYDRSFLC